ncbi:MAG: biopolymer transporter ExbD [Opitutaceae bacterium]|nr:biopolymer transporter ExbD [Opitutaceae bacterium]
MNAPDPAAELAGPKKARVEIIPMIDVIFFLLATFVLFTLSLERIRELETPFASGTGERRPPEDNLVAIHASAEGTYFWKRGESPTETITAGELRLRLEDFARSTAQPRVMIRSDRTATLGAAVLVLDEVRRAGIKQVAVETLVSVPAS